ncbi:hypothetical protein STRA110950_06095 [Streptobacillus ratti]
MLYFLDFWLPEEIHYILDDIFSTPIFYKFIIFFCGTLGTYLASTINIKRFSFKVIFIALISVYASLYLIRVLSLHSILTFYIYIMLYSVLWVMLDTYIHLNLIKNENSRTTVISIINTFKMIIISLFSLINFCL